MGKQLSFNKYERKILPLFRDHLNKAESAEDVRKVFSYSFKELFEQIFAEKDVRIDSDDITLEPEKSPFYQISGRLRSLEAFSQIWHASDISNLLFNMAKTARNRFVRLEKHFDKTEAKIRR